MEECLILLFQLFVEILADILVYSGFDWPWSGSGSKDKDFSFWLLAFLVFGGIAGFMSVWLFPTLLIKIVVIRMINLILCPLVSGLTAWQLARFRQKHDHEINPAMHAFYGAVFAFGYIAVRFALGTR